MKKNTFSAILLESPLPWSDKTVLYSLYFVLIKSRCESEKGLSVYKKHLDLFRFHLLKSTNEININTVKSRYKDHSKLGPPSLLRPLVSAPKYIFQYNWVSIIRPIHYYDHFRQVPLVVLLAGLYCTDKKRHAAAQAI